MRKIMLTFAVATAALSLNACDAIDPTKQQDPSPAAQDPAVQPATGGAPSAAAGVSGVKVTQDPTLGKVLTDWQGLTLYRSDKDSAKPPKSNCTGDCLTKWPAVAYVDGLKIEGISEKLIGKLQRSDGSLQLTVNGWPAYRFAADSKVGDIKGQGVSRVWFAFTPEGKKAQAVVIDPGSGGGY